MSFDAINTFKFLFFTQMFATIVCKNICLNNRFSDSKKELVLSSGIPLKKSTQFLSDCLTLNDLKNAKMSKRKKTFIYSLEPAISQLDTEATTDEIRTSKTLDLDKRQRSGQVIDTRRKVKIFKYTYFYPFILEQTIQLKKLL